MKWEGAACTAASIAVSPVSSALEQGFSALPAGHIATRPALQDLDVIAAVRGARSGQATYIAETLYRHFQTGLC